ncbi:Indoleamine 2,3-dioxygenase [Aspergillus egyptiacus]|nr:Indoleamine 2,3-dioxygenase [Aspergillus egyptiacus]
MRSYMPGPHRRFLEDLEKGPSLRDFVTREPSDDALVRAFHHAVEQLAKLRSKHLQVVARYVVLPATRKARSSSAVTSVQKQGERRELHGTGGMPVMTFLKQVRDETVLAVGSG